MNKTDKLKTFFKKRKISIDVKHKKLVKDSLSKNKTEKKERLKLIFIPALSMLTLIIICTSIFFILKFNQRNNFLSFKYLKDQKQQDYLHYDYFDSLNRKTEDNDQVKKEKKEDLDMQILYAYTDTSKAIDMPNSTKDKDNMTKKEKSSEKKYESEKEEFSGKTRPDDSTLETKDDKFYEIKKSDPYQTNNSKFNRIIISPNVRYDSYYYMNRQLFKHNPIDNSRIKDDELVNFFCKDIYPKSIINNLFIELACDNMNNYFLTAYFKANEIIKNPEIEILFYPAINSYKAIGAPLKTNYYQSKRTNYMIEPLKSLIVLVKFDLQREISDINEIGIVNLKYYNSKNQQVKQQKKIKLNDLKKLIDSTPIIKSAILGYIFSSIVKNSYYTYNDFLEYKSIYIDYQESFLSTEQKAFINNFINNFKF